MPIQTNLSGPPYNDDTDPLKDYYRVLFKGGYSVQMRELNSMQALFQQQIERFADNIFSVGTIVAGCNFQFYKNYNYIKLPDVQTTGEAVDPGAYVGKFVTDDVTNLRAFIVNHQDGFELSVPDLKTIYIKYIDSGSSGEATTFSPGNNITIKDSNNPIDDIIINNGGSGFTNTDTVVILPALVVNVVTGSFAPSDYLVNPSTQANVEIVTVDTSTVPGKAVLTIKPRSADLTNAQANSTAWTLNLYDAVTTPAGTTTAVIEQINGQDAQARIRTNAVGAVNEILMLNKGKGYIRGATAVVKTSNATATVGVLDLSPKNFVAKIKIPIDAEAVGTGYAFGVTQGQIYQQGHFLRVQPQTVIVSKYNNTPNNVVVGFTTTEEIIDATEDSSLFDNATGEPNELAPGADRLKLVPELLVLTKEQAFANSNFFGLVEWNDGKPAIQNPSTTYSAIGDAMARDLYDSSGNFVLDAFQVTTETPANLALESTKYTCVIDPGQAYINGRKVQTLSNYKIDMQKGLDTRTSNNFISLAYGNYIRCNNLAGQIDFSSGAELELYDFAANYYSNGSVIETATITTQGQQIGTARIRSMELESGYPGTISAVYKLYLFKIEMNAGKNFKDVKSVYYNGATYDGIADVIQTFEATTQSNVAQIHSIKEDGLLFYAGVESLKNSNNTTYVFRTTEVVNTSITTATLTKTLTDLNEFFPWSGDLSSTEMASLIVCPVEAHLESANLTGSVAVTSSSNVVTGTATDFDSAFDIGDYIMVTDASTNTDIRRITGITNSTSLIVDGNFSFTDATIDYRRVFPKHIPVPFGQRPGLYANVDGTGKILTLEFRHSNSTPITLLFANATLETQISYDVSRQGVTAASKSANRNKYIKIFIANSEGQAEGPWCLGVPDALRLRAVYIGNSTVNTSSTDVTESFYIDHNQNPNYMGLSFLFLKPKTNLTLESSDYLLCCFDYFTRDNQGYYDTTSYLRTANAATIATIDAYGFHDLSLQSSASSWEVPEVWTSDGAYFDLYRSFDFRPTAANTVAPASDATSAPVNPPETLSFVAHSKIPKPNATMKTTVEQYLGRIDDIYIGQKSQIFILKGIPDVNPRNRYQSNHPKDSLRLQTLIVPPYPNLATQVPNVFKEILNTNVGNEKYQHKRIKDHQIVPWINSTNLQTSQPMVYTMEDIASLERRIKDLEYYVALSLLETNITNRIIPSSVDPQLDRFKFGFFADDFSSTLYSDLANPQYAASIEVTGDLLHGTIGNPLSGNSASPIINEDVAGLTGSPALKYTYRLVPPKRVWQLKHYTENVYYIDQEILEQTNATQAPSPCVVTIANVTISNTSSTTGGADTVQYSYYLQVNRAQSTVWINSSTGLANIYFDIRAGATKGFGGKISVLDETGTVVASTDYAHNGQKLLGPNDIFFLSTNPVANDFHHAISKQTYKSFSRLQGALQDFGAGAGKLPLKIPLGGGRFVIKTEVSNTSVLNDPSWKMLIEFPGLFTENTGELNANGQNIKYTIISDPDCSPLPPSYIGSLESGTLTLQTWACSNLFRTMAAGYRAFVLIGTGLKPNTRHNLYLDTVPWTYVVPMFPGPSTYAESGGIAAKIASASIKGVYNFGTAAIQANLETGEASFFTVEENTRLNTNDRGQIVCLVFFPASISGWFSQDFNAPGYDFDLIYGAKSGDPGRANELINAQLLNPTYGSSGYTTLVLQDASGASQAVRVFANRTPNKTIPYDPLGWI